ncbi:MAG: hypothetical protein FWG50_09470, partial [Kiritimatiellaeota bacterium]|nr:hypothetical protein [Kiritimatiellota bacterium]
MPQTATTKGPGLPSAGIVEKRAYTQKGLTATRTDARGNTTAYTYDKRGLPLTVKDPLNNTTTFTYDAAGRLLTTKDPRGNVSSNAYDTAGNKVAQAFLPAGAPASQPYSLTTFSYDPLDRLLWTKDPRGHTVTNAYDDAGRLTGTMTPTGDNGLRATDYAHDLAGNLLQTTVSATAPTYHLSPITYHFSHDPLGRLLTTVSPTGLVTSNAYDAAHNLISTHRSSPTDSSFLIPNLHFGHDAVGNVTAKTRPSGATDAFAYDHLGNTTAHTNAEGRAYTMSYDALGRLIAATNALGQQVFRNTYDNAGNLTSRTDGEGFSVGHTYDAMNRLTSTATTIPNSSLLIPNSSFTYDACGNMLTAANAHATLTFAYDGMNALTSAVTKISNPSFLITNSWQRDPGGLVTNLVYAPGQNVSYAYDEEGLLTSVKDWLGNQWTFTRDAMGRKVAQAFLPAGNGGQTSPSAAYTYDPAGRLASWQVGTLAGRAITYDALGRRTRDDITAGPLPKPTLQRTAQNTFDAADKLVSASVRYGQGADSTPHITETFHYDNNGALTNWFSPIPNSSFLITNSLSLTYNALGQLTCTGGSRTAPAASFAYDALGNRLGIAPSICSLDMGYLITDHADPLKRPLMEVDDEGEVMLCYIWGDNQLLGIIDPYDGDLIIAHSDDFGNVIAHTDSAGNVLFTAAYGPHGEDWGSTGYNFTPFGWLGGYGVQLLETDTPLRLYLTRHRVYSATLNRFLSSDPLGLAGGLNLYMYGEGNPVAYMDPLGLCAQYTHLGGGFWEGLQGGGSIIASTFTLGYSDVWGWTDSSQYQGTEYTVSRVSAAVGALAFVQAGALYASEAAGAALVNWGAGAAGAGAAAQQVFYSGSTAAQRAAETFARANNGIVITDTPAGQAIVNQNLPW